MIYPSNCQVRFTPNRLYDLAPPHQNREGRFTPQIVCTIYPPQNRPILSKISDTQHHALLHKGLFCERPITRMHSSRMRIARLLAISPSMHCAGGLYALGGVWSQGWGALGGLLWGWGVVVCSSGQGVCYPSMH